MTLCSTCLDYTTLNVGSNWTHKGGSPGGWLHICWGLWDLYWKPLRKQDISDRREQDKQLKNDENGKENETPQGVILKNMIVHPLHVCVEEGWWCYLRV